LIKFIVNFRRFGDIIIYKSIIRPLIFKLDPELSHNLAETALKFSFPMNPFLKLIEVKDNSLSSSIGKIEVPNPIGVAAGLDKNYKTSINYLNFGFGFALTGTILAHQNFGNPKPRLLRYLDNKSIVNSLGFPSEGLDKIIMKFSKSDIEKKRVFASISGLNIDDIYRCFKELSPLVVGIELNISSPNTQGLKDFHNLKNLEKLLKVLNNDKNKPLIVKLPPCVENQNNLFEIVKCVQYSGSDGVVISNSHPIKDSNLNVGFGGLSGKPIYEHTLKMVHKVRKIVGKEFTVIGSGGVTTTSDVWKLIASGANAVQIYSGIIFEGPFIANKINKELKNIFLSHKISSVKELFCSEIPFPKAQ
jgi:dihydroorotate dehydrogenase